MVKKNDMENKSSNFVYVFKISNLYSAHSHHLQFSCHNIYMTLAL